MSKLNLISIFFGGRAWLERTSVTAVVGFMDGVGLPTAKGSKMLTQNSFTIEIKRYLLIFTKVFLTNRWANGQTLTVAHTFV